MGLVHRYLPGLVTSFGRSPFYRETGRYFRFLEFIPEWMVPGKVKIDTAVDFFEGGPVPWEHWIFPLFLWSLLFAAVFAGMLCIGIILRRQWSENEGLSFPMLELPRAMLEGMAVPVIIFTINGLHHYFPQIGEISTSLDMGEILLEAPWKAMAAFEARFVFDFSPMIVGIAYLLSLEISFSIWFFFLMTRVQLLATEFLGFTENRGVCKAFGLEWPPHFPFLFS